MNGPYVDERLVDCGTDDGATRHDAETVRRRAASLVGDARRARVQVPRTRVP